MRIMWKLYAYQHTKMKRQHAPATSNKCTFCNRMCETQTHMMECTGDEATKLRTQAQQKILQLLIGQVPESDPGLKAWLENFGEKIWDGSMVDMPHSRYLEN